MSEANTDHDRKRHPIQVVSRRLGLTVDVLRVWEKRYGLVTPARSTGGHRLYSDADIEKLRLIREAMAGGRRVGGLAELSTEQLTTLVNEDRREALTTVAIATEQQAHGSFESYVANCLQAVRALDGALLMACFDRAVITFPPAEFIDNIATQLMHRIGDLWQEGRLTPGHEHLASSVLRNKLAEITAALQPDSGANNIVVATPAGQQHEIGAFLVAASAQLEGWRVTYLGPDLPATDIARAAEQTNAAAVALSITVANSGYDFAEELRLLRRFLPKHVVILVGGQAAAAYRNDLEAIGASFTADLPQVRKALREFVASAAVTTGPA
jgi:methanogenic corrinoid protein MtbC1